MFQDLRDTRWRHGPKKTFHIAFRWAIEEEAMHRVRNGTAKVACIYRYTFQFPLYITKSSYCIVPETDRCNMVLKRLLSALLNKAQVVEKLAELRPIRRAAQLTAYALMKAKIAGKEATTKLLKFKTVRQIRHEASGLPQNAGEMGRKAGRLRDSIVKDVKDGIRDTSRQVKDKDK